VNGYTVASLDNHAAVADVAVYVKAGSRYESYDQRGVTHLLRNCAFFVSKFMIFLISRTYGTSFSLLHTLQGNDKLTTFGISRSMDFIGGFYK